MEFAWIDAVAWWHARERLISTALGNPWYAQIFRSFESDSWSHSNAKKNVQYSLSAVHERSLVWHHFQGCSWATQWMSGKWMEGERAENERKMNERKMNSFVERRPPKLCSRRKNEVVQFRRWSNIPNFPCSSRGTSLWFFSKMATNIIATHKGNPCLQHGSPSTRRLLRQHVNEMGSLFFVR